MSAKEMTVYVVLILALLGTVVLVLAAYRLFFSGHIFIMTTTPDGGRRTFGGGKITVDPPPDKYEANGFDYLGPYVVRLLESDGSFSSLSIFTPDGKRGFSIRKQDGVMKANLVVHWREEPEREAAIRAFFDSMSVEPTEDDLAGIRDATRFLSYPIQGDASTITGLVERILNELCGISPNEALNIEYSDR